MKSSSVQILHPVLGEVDVEAVEQSSQQSPDCSHDHKDDQVIGIPQFILILCKNSKTLRLVHYFNDI